MTDRPDVPAAVPEDLATTLRTLEDQALRETVGYLRALLDEHRQRRLQRRAEAVPDDELVRVTDRDGYLEVVRGHRCPDGCPECPHDPSVYRVREVRGPDGEPTVNWQFIGPAKEP